MKQEYQPQLCLCEKKRHRTIVDMIRLYLNDIDFMQGVFLVLVIITKVEMNSFFLIINWPHFRD